MTVNTTKITSGPYAGNDVADTFSYTFRVIDKTQLSVYETDATGVQTLLVVDTDYTVNSVGNDGGGTITRLAGALPTNYQWYIRSNYQETQLTAFNSQGAFFPDLHEDAMDKLTLLLQQLLDKGDRSFRLSDVIDIDGVFTIGQNAAERAGLALGFDSLGNLILKTAFDPGLIDQSTLDTRYRVVFATVAAMKAVNPTDISGNQVSLAAGMLVDTQGYNTSGDGGAGTYLISGNQVVDTYSDHLLNNNNVALLQPVNRTLIPAQFGAVSGQDATASFIAMSAKLDSDYTVDFGKADYIVSATGVPSSAFGHRIFDLNDVDNVTFKADKCIIKVVNHDIATNGGLNFIWAKACNGLTVKGFDFDMSFTGVHTGSTQYPWCSAIVGSDGSDADEGGVRTQDQLNGNWTIKDNTFKLFHPYGQFAQSGSAYNGDPNNGFKLFPCFVSGPFDAVNYANQCRKITIDNCTLKEGGNSYGFWCWSWNDVSMTKCSAESFVGKQSNAAGVYSGVGEPMLRYHQFYCSGLSVVGNYFRAKPCNERTVAGFEGAAMFLHYNTNLNGDFSHGVCTVADNTIIMGRGDAAKSAADWGIYLIAYGSISVTGNSFDSTDSTVNALGSSVGIYWNAESTGPTGGKTTLAITGNTFSLNLDYTNNITISNGAATDAGRRLKQLVVEGNTSLGQAQYFLQMSVTNTFYGVQDIKVCNNLVNGEFNTLWSPASSNSRAIEVGGSETTDMCDVSKNVIRGKYYGIETNGHSGRFVADYNEFISVTTRWLGAIPIISDRRDNAPTDAAADGSSYIRTNGIVANVLYMREAGAWVVVG